MKDLFNLASMASHERSPERRKERFCDLLLEQLKTLKGRDLAPYLSEFNFIRSMPGIKILLEFPIDAHVFDALCGDLETDQIAR